MLSNKIKIRKLEDIFVISEHESIGRYFNIFPQMSKI